MEVMLVSVKIAGMENDLFLKGLRAYFDDNPSLKPAAVSVKAGLNESTIRKMLENEKASPKVRNAHAIASALSLSIEYLIAYGEGGHRAAEAGVSVLTQRDRALLDMFRQLPEHQQDAVMKVTDALTESGLKDREAG